MKLTKKALAKLIEGILFSEGKPVTVEKIRSCLPKEDRPPLGELRAIIEELQRQYQNRGVNLIEVASGYRFQVAEEVSIQLLEQQEEKPMRLSRAFMETLALVAYRQPITRGEIEDIRGVAVSQNIIKGLLELEWIREVGHKEVPGKPALLATSKKFLDFFNLKALSDLPPLAVLEELAETRLQEEIVEMNAQEDEQVAAVEAERTSDSEMDIDSVESVESAESIEQDESTEALESAELDESDESIEAVESTESEVLAELVEDIADDIETIEAELELLPDELDEEEEDVTVESASNHQPIETFSEIVMTYPELPEKQEKSSNE